MAPRHKSSLRLHRTVQVLLHDRMQRSPAVNVNEVLYQVTVVVIDYKADSRRIATLQFVMQTDDIAQ